MTDGPMSRALKAGLAAANCPLCGLPYQFARIGWTYEPANAPGRRFVVYVHVGGRECRDEGPTRKPDLTGR